MVPLAPAAMTISGSIFQPSQLMLLIKGWYLWILFLTVSFENLSVVYVNSTNWTVRLSARFSDGVLWCGSSLIHRRSGLNLVLYVASLLSTCTW